MELRFPVVEDYAFALQKNMIRCDVGALDPLVIEPNREPTATFVRPTVGYQEGSPVRRFNLCSRIARNTMPTRICRRSSSRSRAGSWTN